MTLVSSSPMAGQQTLFFGRFRLEPEARVLFEGERRLRLGSRAMEILLALIERAGGVVSKEELLARVWPGLHVDEAALRVHISALRKALGDDPAAPLYVLNEAGRGYRFVAPIMRADDLPVTMARPPVHPIGREATICDLITSLRQSGFVTITGPGGIGKTTVALNVAASLVGSYADGQTFVDLAALADSRLLPSAVASAFRLRPSSGDSKADLIAWVRNRQMLLLLDNCEHLVDAAAALGEQIRAAAPEVHLLTTSREPLRAVGEWVARLPPLGLPPRSGGAGPKDALDSPAIRLFVERARAADDGFALNDDNTASVIDICHRLDGIPLAIEFAAAWVGVIGAKELLARLDDRFALLRTGLRTALPRHQTLRATLDWSYQLLPEQERILLQRLASFRGSFTLDAVQAVADVSGEGVEDLLDSIANLVAKSLLNASSEGGTTLYRLLETIRAYAVERLAQSGDGMTLARRLAEYLNVLLRNAELDWATMSAPQWNSRYAHVIDDVRAALDWAFSAEGNATLAVELTASSSRLWFRLALVAEYRAWAERALLLLASGAIDAPVMEMRLNISFASATLHTGGPVTERAAAYARALDIATRMHDTGHQLRALWGLAGQRYLQGEYNEALEFCERFNTIVAAFDDGEARLVRDRMMALGLHLVGRQDEARHYAERALVHAPALVRCTHTNFQEYDNRVVSRSHLARILWLQGFPCQATEIAREGVELARSLDHPLPLCYILASAACPIAFWTGDLEAARHYVDALRTAAAVHSFGYWTSWHRCYDIAVGLDRENGPNSLQRALGRLGDLAAQPVYCDMLVTLRPELAGPEAVARVTAGAAGWCAPEVLRTQSIGVLRRGDNQAASQATALLQQSYELARRQGALSWELRSATSLARHQRGTSDAGAARTRLERTIVRFTEGFATADLRDATAVLEVLSG